MNVFCRVAVFAVLSFSSAILANSTDAECTFSRGQFVNNCKGVFSSVTSYSTKPVICSSRGMIHVTAVLVKPGNFIQSSIIVTLIDKQGRSRFLDQIVQGNQTDYNFDIPVAKGGTFTVMTDLVGPAGQIYCGFICQVTVPQSCYNLLWCMCRQQPKQATQ